MVRCIIEHHICMLWTLNSKYIVPTLYHTIFSQPKSLVLSLGPRYETSLKKDSSARIVMAFFAMIG